MDSPWDPAPQDVAQGSTPAPGPGVMQEWGQALNDPSVRGALLQAGISLLQPPSFGDTAGSQIGRALGDSGEYLNRREEDARKERELSSKEDLRASQANQAESRAAAATANSATAATRADAATQRLQMEERHKGEQDKNRTLSNMIRVQNGYNTYRHQMEEQNRKRVGDIVNPQPALPILTQQEWIAQNPQLQALIGGAGGADSGSIDPLEGRSATGPNGEKMIRRGGKWVPANGE